MRMLSPTLLTIVQRLQTARAQVDRGSPGDRPIIDLQPGAKPSLDPVRLAEFCRLTAQIDAIAEWHSNALAIGL